MVSESIAYAFCWVVLLFVGLRFWRKRFHPVAIPYSIEVGFLVKATAAIGFVCIYNYFLLSNDAFAYLEDSRILHAVFSKSPSDYFKFLFGGNNTETAIQTFLSETSLWSRGYTNLINDSQNVIRVNSLIYFVSLGNPYVHALLMGLISLLGVHHLTQAFKHKISSRPALFFWGLLLLPNALFWASGILKEPFVVLGLGLFVRGIFSSETGKRNYWYITIGILLLIGFKPYVLVAMLVGLSFYVLSQLVFATKPFIALSTWIGLVTLFLLAFPAGRNQLASNITRKQNDSLKVGKGGLYVQKDSATFYYFHTAHLHRLTLKDSTAQLNEISTAWVKKINQNDQFKPITLHPNDEKWNVYLALDSSKSLISISPINNSFANLLKNSPEALSNAAFRPFPTDNSSALKLPSILETTVVFALLVFACWKRRKLNFQEQRLLIAIVLFAVCIFLLVGWTTPVNNAIVRYRIPAFMAIFAISLFVIETPDSWKTKKK